MSPYSLSSLDSKNASMHYRVMEFTIKPCSDGLTVQFADDSNLRMYHQMSNMGEQLQCTFILPNSFSNPFL